jgi:CRISPR-associated protein Csh1
MCHQTDIETYGFASPFSFYTIDKPGYISGGFQKSMIPYNYPVCRMCSIWLLLGKKYLDEHLTFNAFGKSLYIIPKTKNTSSLSRVLNNLKKLNHAD